MSGGHTVYLLHFSEPYKHAQHYIGVCLILGFAMMVIGAGIYFGWGVTLLSAGAVLLLFALYAASRGTA